MKRTVICVLLILVLIPIARPLKNSDDNFEGNRLYDYYSEPSSAAGSFSHTHNCTSDIDTGDFSVLGGPPEHYSNLQVSDGNRLWSQSSGVSLTSEEYGTEINYNNTYVISQVTFIVHLYRVNAFASVNITYILYNSSHSQLCNYSSSYTDATPIGDPGSTYNFEVDTVILGSNLVNATVSVNISNGAETTQVMIDKLQIGLEGIQSELNIITVNETIINTIIDEEVKKKTVHIPPELIDFINAYGLYLLTGVLVAVFTIVKLISDNRKAKKQMKAGLLQQIKEKIKNKFR